MNKIYRASFGASFGHKKAQVYGRALEDLKERLGRAPTVDDIVEAAKPSRSPLHSAFTWNLKKAAAERWRAQARHVANHIDVEIVMGGKREMVRAFHSVHANGVKPLVYENVETVAANPFQKDEIVQYALREADQWRKKYSLYSRFDSKVRVIASAIRKVVKKRQ